MKNVFSLLCLCFLMCNSLKGEWDPVVFAEDHQGCDSNSLNDLPYKKLKESVTHYLTNSWCSEEKANLLMDLVLLTKPEVCVEIGAFTGSSSLPIASTLKYLKNGKLYAIDAWSNNVATRFMEKNDPNKGWWLNVDMSLVHELFTKMVNKWDLKPFIAEIKKESDVAAKEVSKIDFLHLDGDFTEEGSLRDVVNYLPKVKSGGYILLSNFFTMVNGKQTKLKSFCSLFDECDIVCDIEKEHAILFRKR